MFKETVTRDTQKPTLAPLKTCAIDRSRGVDMFKKKFARKVHLRAKLSASEVSQKKLLFSLSGPNRHDLGYQLSEITLKGQTHPPPKSSAETITLYLCLRSVENSYKIMFYDVSELFACIFILTHRILVVFMKQNY